MRCSQAVLLAASIALTAAPPPGIEGDWQGTLEAGIKLRLAVHIKRAAPGGYTATLDSIDQGAMGLPVDSVALNGRAVRLELNRLGASYEGTLSMDGASIEGQWKQAGASLPLALRRFTKAAQLERPQEPARPYPYNEEEVVLQNKAASVKLAGTLTTPRSGAPFAAVLLISGSGPQDRNESVFGHRPFLVLADYLTRRGIAVLRCDDRGVGGSTGSLRASTTEDLTGDALAAVEYLRGRKEIDPARIGLVGHSEGALIAPLAAVKDPRIAFLVLMAPPGVVGEEILYQQGRAIAEALGADEEAVSRNAAQQRKIFGIVKQEKDPAAVEKRIRAMFDEALAGMSPEQRKSVDAGIKAQIEQVTSPWFRFFLTHDPAPALAKVRQPVFAVAGRLDLQVPPEENLAAVEKALAAGGNKDFQVRSLPGLNHLFQTAKTGAPGEYGSITETIAPAALDAIAGWILRHVQK